jgi:hypothetical protein
MENKEYYKKIFTLLVDYELIPNSESDNYNFISHSIGINDKISWPYTNYKSYWPVKRELSKESFDSFYEYHGYEKCSMDFSHDPRYTKVAIYMNNNKPTHACIQYDEKHWESKIGSLGIIRHDLFELEDKVYGQVVQIYRKRKFLNEILLFSDYIKNLYK